MALEEIQASPARLEQPLLAAFRVLRHAVDPSFDGYLYRDILELEASAMSIAVFYCGRSCK